MTPHRCATSISLVALAVGVGKADTPALAADDSIPLDVAEVYFELNDTDGDLGIHALIDGEPWKVLKISDPKGRRLLDIQVRGRLRRQGLTELFYESAEPSFDELAPEDFFDRFPEGTYTIKGVTLEREKLQGMATITHLLPAPPDNVQLSGTDAAEGCDANPLTKVAAPIEITWDSVDRSHPELGRTDEPINVVRYQVVVAREDPPFELSVELDPDTTSFTVPADLLESGDKGIKFEILVREDSGNQTAIESCFDVE